MTVCDHRSIGRLGGQSLAEDRREGQPDHQRRIADRLEQRHVFGGHLRRLAHTGVHQVIHYQPGHADRQGRLVPGKGAQLLQLFESAGDVRMDPPAAATQQGAGR